jgi:hypothetical protein
MGKGVPPMRIASAAEEIPKAWVISSMVPRTVIFGVS